VPADTFVFALAFSAYCGADRAFYQLAHNLVMAWPGLGFVRRYRTVAAAHEHAARALGAGAAVLVYPGGDYETHRPSWSPLASISIITRASPRSRSGAGSRSCRSSRSVSSRRRCFSPAASGSRALRLDRYFHSHVLPISLGLPWGVNIGDLLGHVPLPPKTAVQVLPPIDLCQRLGSLPSLDDAYDHIIGVLQRTLDDPAAERRLPIIG
jgi:hypothetical protein